MIVKERMRRILIGNPFHWPMIVLIALVLAWMGVEQFHRLQFMSFLVVVLALAAVAVAFILATYRPGDRVTRERLETED